MTERKKLSDILQGNSDPERLKSLWKATAAAAEFAPLPPGEYAFRILAGELFTSKRGTPGYKLTLEVIEGDCEGRRAWCDFWLTPAALPMAKRDLAKIGITDLDQLEKPLPPGILIRGRMVLRRDDDGNESNKLARFDCIGTEPADAFEPKDDGDGQAGGPPDAFPFGDNTSTPTEPAPAPQANGVALAGTHGAPPAGTNGNATTPKRRKKAGPAPTPYDPGERR
jgi:hypothetical protein